jgi:hypothetical protein
VDNAISDLTCVATTRRGFRCHRDTVDEAPFPLCMKHMAEVFQFVNERLAQETPVAAALRVMQQYDGHGPGHEVPPPLRKTPVVYYLRVGDHIKIGFSVDFLQRMRQYPPNAQLLAFEYGDRTLERSRHRQFWHALRFGQEWFAPSVDLLTHIERLAKV